jgi:hypothetical protein
MRHIGDLVSAFDDGDLERYKIVKVFRNGNNEYLYECERTYSCRGLGEITHKPLLSEKDIYEVIE